MIKIQRSLSSTPMLISTTLSIPVTCISISSGWGEVEGDHDTMYEGEKGHVPISSLIVLLKCDVSKSPVQLLQSNVINFVPTRKSLN